MKLYALVPMLAAAALAGSLSADYGRQASPSQNSRSQSATLQNIGGKSYSKDQFKTESDQAVNKRIRQLVIGEQPHSFDEIILRTSEGVVVIDGFVYSLADQKSLSDQVEQVNGVKHLVNNTKIKKQ